MYPILVPVEANSQCAAHYLLSTGEEKLFISSIGLNSRSFPPSVSFVSGSRPGLRCLLPMTIRHTNTRKENCPPNGSLGWDAPPFDKPPPDDHRPAIAATLKRLTGGVSDTEEHVP